MGCRRIEKTRSTMRGDMLRFATRLCQCVAHDVGHVGEGEQALHPRGDRIWVYPCIHRDTRRQCDEAVRFPLHFAVAWCDEGEVRFFVLLEVGTVCLG